MSLDMIKGLKRKGEIEFVNEKSKDFSGWDFHFISVKEFVKWYVRMIVIGPLSKVV
jgi:hypothetical protein